MAKFQPWMGTAASYAAIVTKNAGVLYFLSDTQEIYRGTALLVRSGDAVRTTGNQTVAGTKTFSSQIVSSVAQGTAPLSVTSTTVCQNLNANLLQGNQATAFATASHVHSSIVTDTLIEPSYVKSNITKTAKPLFDVLRANRLYFLPADQIIIEKSIDAGVTWVDAGISDVYKRQLFDGERITIALPLKNGVRSTDCMIRITITGMKYNVPGGTPETSKYDYWNSSYVASTERYCSLNDMWAWVASVTDSIYCKVERATGASSTSWVQEREAYMNGWSGGNYVSLSNNRLGGSTSQTGNYWNWRFTFRTCTNANTFVDANLSTSYTTSPQAIYDIKATGPDAWVLPNSMMYKDHLYTWDYLQNATFPSMVSATSFTGKFTTARTIFGNSFDGSANVTGQALVNGTYAEAGGGYTSGGLQIREADLVGSAQTSDLYAPRIGFHWGYRIGMSIIATTSGFKFENQAQNGYVPLTCAGLTATTGAFSGNVTAASLIIGNPQSTELIRCAKDGNNYIWMQASGSVGVTTSACGGTIASPTATIANTFIGLWSMRGHNGTTWSAAADAYIGGKASSLWSSTNKGNFMVFNTTINGQTSSAERMRIDAIYGALCIGTTSSPGNYKLAVSGSSFFGGAVKVDTSIDLFESYAGYGDIATPFYSTFLTAGASTSKTGIQWGNEANATSGSWLRFFVNAATGDNTPVYPFRIGHSVCAFTTNLTVAGSLTVTGTVTASAFYES